MNQTNKLMFDDFIWMDILRGLAVVGVVIHHGLIYIPFSSSIQAFTSVANLIQTAAGTVVHLFFILSGCGLTLSFYRRRPVSWIKWAQTRFRKIVIPYMIIVTLTYFLANFASFIFPDLNTVFHPLSLFSYLTFTRNFYSPGWGLNPTLWFMPVLIGLYAMFPLCIKIIEKYGLFFLLQFCLIVTYGSIMGCIMFGYPVSHQSALFSFYVIEFFLGMFIGCRLSKDLQWLDKLLGVKMFCLGLFLYLISWAIKRSWSFGGEFNDLFTAMSICLIGLNLCLLLTRFAPPQTVDLFKAVSKQSYLMYLIHGPLLIFVVRPLLVQMETPIHSLNAILLAFLYCLFIFFLTWSLSLIKRRFGHLSLA